LLLFLVAAVGVAVLAAIVTVVINFVILPARRRRWFIAAAKIIKQDRRPEFEEAERMLNRALAAGMRGKDITDARFALAYVRASRERFAEAVTALEEMGPTKQQDRETVYFLLWLRSRQEEHDEVEELHRAHGDRVKDFLDAKLIVGIAFLTKARRLWDERKIDAALAYFERVEKLGMLQEHMPAHVANHRIVFGVDALLQKETEVARRHFEEAHECAGDRVQAAAEAQLGLLLCRWLEEEYPQIDEELGDVVARLAAARSSTARRDKTDKEPSPEEDEKPELSDEDKLLRNASLWHGVSLLYVWLRLKANAGLPTGELEKLSERLGQVTAIDPDMGDAYLIEGLIRYYFCGDDPELRKKAVELLDKALSRDVNLPEVRELFNQEQRLAEQERDADRLFIKLVKNHVRNPKVSEEARQDLKNRLRRYKGLGDRLDRIAVGVDVDDPLPVARELEARSRNLRRRLDRIVRAQGAAARDAGLDALIKELGDREKEAIGQMEKYERSETNALISTAETLLPEEVS